MSARRGRRLAGVFIRIAGGLLLAGLIAFLLRKPILEACARWLIIDEPVTPNGPADAVCVLAGGEGERLRGAIDLYLAGSAHALLITGTDTPFLRVYTSEDSLTAVEVKRRIAVKHGVPADSIVIGLGPGSTWDEAREVRRQALAHGWRSVIVVTDPFHTRRSHATFHHVLAGSGVTASIFHVPIGQSSQDPHRWWTQEDDTMALFTESVKLGFYWSHYGVRPWE